MPPRTVLLADAAPSSSYRQPTSHPDVGAESTISELPLAHQRSQRDVPSGKGRDFAGIVAELGPSVSQFSVGNEVIGYTLNRPAMRRVSC